MSVKIYVDDIRFLRNLLVQRGFAHAFTINNSIGGYSLKFKANIEVVCFFREIQEIFLILNEMKKTKYLIFATPVQMMRGQFRCRSEFD